MYVHQSKVRVHSYLLVFGPLDVSLKGILAGADHVTELAEVASLGRGGGTDPRRLLLLLLLVQFTLQVGLVGLGGGGG